VQLFKRRAQSLCGVVRSNSRLWRIKPFVFQYAGMVNDKIRRHSLYLSLYGRVMVFRSNYHSR
jgi:hypothetical protein